MTWHALTVDLWEVSSVHQVVLLVELKTPGHALISDHLFALISGWEVPLVRLLLFLFTAVAAALMRVAPGVEDVSLFCAFAGLLGNIDTDASADTPLLIGLLDEAFQVLTRRQRHRVATAILI